MAEFFDKLLHQVDPITAYIILGVSAFVENTLPPIPGDTVTIVGAYLVSIGKLSFTGVYLSTTLGSILGFFLMYYMGIKFGRSFLKSKFRAKIFNDDKIKKVEIWFAKYGYWVITANRFLSGARSIISLFAGFFHLKWYLVLLLSTLSALIWNGLLITAGYLLGVNWDVLLDIISQYNRLFILLVLLIAGYYIVKKYMRKKKKAVD